MEINKNERNGEKNTRNHKIDWVVLTIFSCYVVAMLALLPLTMVQNGVHGLVQQIKHFFHQNDSLES